MAKRKQTKQLAEALGAVTVQDVHVPNQDLMKIASANCVLLDFTNSTSLLKKLNGLAEKEYRTVENQILYMLIKAGEKV